MATGELAARTYIDEGRAPTQEELASTSTLVDYLVVRLRGRG